MKFTLFATGGTLASVSSDAGLTPGVSAEALLRLCPDLMGFEHDIDAVDIMSKDSSNMRPEDWFEIAERIRGVAAEHDAQDEPVSRAAQGGARLRATEYCRAILIPCCRRPETVPRTRSNRRPRRYIRARSAVSRGRPRPFLIPCKRSRCRTAFAQRRRCPGRAGLWKA